VLPVKYQSFSPLEIAEKFGVINEVIGFTLNPSLSGKGDTEGFIFHNLH
jgi:hypothetical protein